MGPKLAVRCTSRTILHPGIRTPHHQMTAKKPFEECFGTRARMRATSPKFFVMHRTEKIPICFHKLERGFPQLQGPERCSYNGKMAAPKRD